MGLDVKMFRDLATLKKIRESEELRGGNLENITKIVDLDREVRTIKRALYETNSILNLNQAKIKSIRISNPEESKSLILQNKHLASQKSSLQVQVSLMKQELNIFLNQIGNILDPQPNTSSLITSNPPDISSLNSSQLMQKLQTLNEIFSFANQRSYEIIQSPSLAYLTLSKQVFPYKNFPIVPSKKPRTLLPSPLASIVLAYSKETLTKTLSFFIQGVYFSSCLRQSEKFSFIIMTDCKSLASSQARLINDCEALIYKYFDPSLIVKTVRNPKAISKAASFQLDYLKLNLNNEYLKICRFSNYTDYISRPASLKINKSEPVSILCMSFSRFFNSLLIN